MTLDIKKQIAALGDEYITKTQQRFTFNGITPYPYQVVMYNETAKRIRNYEHPFFLKASVSAGKTIGFAMVAAVCQAMGIEALFCARQAEIVAQDSEELSNFGVKNSVYCSGLNTKAAYFPIIVGSEGTIINGLDKALADFCPQVLGIDECHQVDWEDLAEAIKNDESRDQMERGKDEPYRVNDQVVERGTKAHEFDAVEYGTKRAQYTIIIIEMMRRCRAKHGRELRIFGMTGSEFRGVIPILQEDKNRLGFWREMVTDINTDYLCEFGSVVPTVFGDTGDLKYDLSDFHASSQDGTADFSAKEMRAMEQKIHESLTTTQEIMKKVAAFAETRNAVLITCAGQRHCKEAAEALPPGSTYAIITEKTGAKQREKILNDVRAGKIKYTFQVMALTTGVNVPNWDFSVILRKIGSLTLLIQLLGRGMRLLKSYQIEQGMKKDDHVVWDFAGTMDELGSLYFNPILEQADFQKRYRNGKDPKKCELCGTENSFYARRCMGVNEKGERCEHFWSFKTCDDQHDQQTGRLLIRGCGAKNDKVARICRCCDVTLKDHNEGLSNKHYTKDDYYGVDGFEVTLTKNQRGLIFKYTLNKNGDHFTAYERFFPESESNICRIKVREVMAAHVEDSSTAKLMGSYKNAKKIIGMAHLIRAPLQVTHRKNGKGEDIIYKKDF